jgi:hypothetical protein
VSASEIYRWARRWQRCHDGKPINQAERWSIRRILVEVAEPIGRAPLAAGPGFGVYVTPNYLPTRLNLLILRRISDNWLATVSQESAQRLKKGGYTMDQTNRDLMLASLQRVAMRMLEVSQADRERVYAGYQKDFAKDAEKAGFPPKEAEEFGQKYLEFLRALVKIIEDGGGAAGGRA